MTHPTPEPEALRLADALNNLEATGACSDSVALTDWSWQQAELAAAELRRLHPFEAECERLKAICVAVHDRLLRGDDDRELLAMLEEAWKK
jgi:hypothetical protein